MFIGAFHRKNHFCDREWTRERWGIEQPFDPQYFDDISQKITRLLGQKNFYSVQDVYRYFHLSYHAYPIGYTQFYNYCNTDAAKLFDLTEPTIGGDSDIELLAEESGKFFSYLADGRPTDESALTMVIDRAVLSEALGMDLKENLILVVGSSDGTSVDSMKVLLTPGIPEIEYALEFFRLHGEMPPEAGN